MLTISNAWLIVDFVMLAAAAVAVSLVAISRFPQDAEQ